MRLFGASDSAEQTKFFFSVRWLRERVQIEIEYDLILGTSNIVSYISEVMRKKDGEERVLPSLSS